MPHDCFIEHVDLEMLGALTTPPWIVLAGSSVQRGTFFALVPTFLVKGAELTESSGPGHFYLEAGSATALREAMIVRAWFGPDWGGRFLIQRHKTMFAGKGEFAVSFTKPPLLQELDAHPALGIEYIDEMHMALPFMHTGEAF